MNVVTDTDQWRRRVDSADWASIRGELDAFGGALLPPLLSPAEASEIRGLYDEAGRFRATINMGRHRFGEGEYRYFARPYPEPVERLKHGQRGKGEVTGNELSDSVQSLLPVHDLVACSVALVQKYWRHWYV